MAKLLQLRTRSDLILQLERTLNEIVKAGLTIEKAGTIVNLITCAKGIIADQEIEEFKKRLEAMEAYVKH